MEDVLKTLVEQEQQFARQMQEQQHILAQQMREQNQRSEDHQRLINQMMEQMKQIGQDRGNQFNLNLDSADTRDDDPKNHRGTFRVNPKVEFPMFDGTNPRGWIKKCTRYFTLCKIPDDQKVDLASLHLYGKAEVWFGGYILARKRVAWEDFVMDLSSRFKDDIGSRVVEDFKNLQQTGSLDDYLDKFEEEGILSDREIAVQFSLSP